ncbi:MAG: YhdP family protein [Methylobacter sp.]|nr:YhdP family protein [Methylobacter sp.]
MIHHITRATRHLIFWSLLILAIGLTVVRLTLSGIDHYKTDLAARFTEVVGAPVQIGRLGAKMRGFSPELVFKDIAVLSPLPGQKSPIEFREIRFGLNLLDLVIKQELLSSAWVTVVGAKLTVKRQADGEIVIVGLKSGEGQPQWLLQGGKYEVLHSAITWQDEFRSAKPLAFDRVDLDIINNGGRHRLNMIAELPKKLGETLTVSMDMEGNLFEPADTRGAMYVDGKKLQLPELAAFDLPLGITIKSGVVDLKIWADWQQAKLVKLAGDVKLQQLNLNRSNNIVFPAKQLNAGFDLSLVNNRWLVNVQHFDLIKSDAAAAEKKQASQFSLAAELTPDAALKNVGLFIDRLDLQPVADVLAFFAPLSEQQALQLKQAQLQGFLDKVSLFADWQQKTLAVNGAFNHFSVASLGKGVPNLVDINGQIKGTEQQGVLKLTSKDGWISFADLFRAPLPIAKLDAAVSWQQTDQDWQLSSDNLVLNSMSFESTNHFRLKLPKNDAPVFLDLQNSFVAGDVTQVTNFLPALVMDTDTLNWLDHAFISGRIAKGDTLFYGNLKDFPFNKGEGVFEVLFTGENFDLAYDPAWPHLTNLNADVLFERDSLKVNIQQAQTEQLTIKPTEVIIPSMNTSKHLLVKGELEGEIAQVLGFMQKTPLNSPVDALLDTITPQGKTQVRLDLAIPLIEQAKTRVNGSAKLNNAELSIKALDLRVSKITGDLKFNEVGVYSDTIRASALGQPIQINIKSNASQTAVNVNGRVGVSDLQAQFNLPLRQVAQGVADYRLTLALPYGDSPPELLVESMLVGVELQLPGGLAKTLQQQRPLSLTIGLEDKSRLPLLLKYDNQLKASLLLDTKQQNLYSAHVLVGEGDSVQDQQPGVTLEIKRDRLPLQDWLNGFAMLQPGKEPQTKDNKGAQIKEIKLHSANALWKSAELGAFDLTFRHLGQDWVGNIDSAVANGKVFIPNDLANAIIKLDMTSVDLNALKQLKSIGATSEQGLSPEAMPLFTLTSQKTLWQATDFGQLIVETERITNGIRFKKIELSNAAQKLQLTGDWKTHGLRSATHLQGRLDMPQASRTLALLGITKDFAETSGSVDFQLDWPSAPYQFALADLRGQADFDLKNGRILSIEPGFGRVLGVLAVAQWIKRIQLDFSDVYGEGMTFNSITGHFDLVNGKAVTKDLIVDAVPAKITITGESDLVNRTGEHIVNVTPKSADAVPIAGTIMGKIMALVGQTLTGKNQEGFFFGSQYLVKGAWSNAQIIPLHENDGVLQKTWNGLTDFSWLQQNNQQEKQHD